MKIDEYFKNLPKDELYAWISIAVGLIFIVLAVLLW